jgi:hypothetical protein
MRLVSRARERRSLPLNEQQMSMVPSSRVGLGG